MRSLVLIESDWNLKQLGHYYLVPFKDSINRIRLEFKGSWSITCTFSSNSINRIRLEFKDKLYSDGLGGLKGINRIRLEFKAWWQSISAHRMDVVLIESDWNLKQIRSYFLFHLRSRINRIRLEFKGDQERTSRGYHSCINRIRLEFKVN